MPTIDYTTLTEEELTLLETGTRMERARRADLAAIPRRIEAEARKFVEGGGNPADLPVLPFPQP